MQNGFSQKPQEQIPSKNNATKSNDMDLSPLQRAVLQGDDKSVEVLLNNGADRCVKDAKHGNTVLHEAAWRGFSRCVKLLCTTPKTVTAKETVNSKQTRNAIQNTQGVFHSALLNTPNSGGFSALHLAAQNGHNQSCREILLAGANADVQNNYGDTPLHTACRYGHAGATRILLSAKCDPLRVNLNGDTALHIASAMGRRKLTRILLQANCATSLKMKNVQGETAHDIAIRKGLREIIDILETPPAPISPVDECERERDRERERSSCSSRNNKKTDKKKNRNKEATSPQLPDVKNTLNWSPYGCHYFPDPRSFPSPKLETLPKEPLSSGEQYYLDLEGNIRKGPVGVGNTCYCGPFFRHIEQRISRNKKVIKKYVHKATEELDSKVQALAIRTDGQIEQITRSMKAGGIKCDGRRYHLEQWLKRGDQIRASLAPHRSRGARDEPNTNSLSRCRSLELLQSDAIDNNMIRKRTSDLRRSIDVLDSEVIVHRGADDQDNTTRTNSQQSCNPGMSSHYNGSLDDRCDELSKSRLSEDQTSSSHRKDIVLSVSERLEGLLSKTNEIIQMKGLARARNGDARAQKWLNDNKVLKVSSSSHYGKSYHNKFPNLKKLYESEDNSTQMINYEMNQITSSLLKSIGGNNDRLLFGKRDDDAHIFNHHPSSEQRESSATNRMTERSGISDSSHEYPSEYHRHKLNSRMLNEPNAEQLVLNGEQQYSNNNGNHMETSDAGHEYTDEHIGRFEYNSSNNGMMAAGLGLFQNTCFEDIRSSDSNIGEPVTHQKPCESLANTSADEVDNGNNFPEMTNTRALQELKSRMLNGAHWRSQVLRESLMTVNKINDNQLSYETAVHLGYNKQKVEHNDVHSSNRSTILGTDMKLSTTSSASHEYSKQMESANQLRHQSAEMNEVKFNDGNSNDSDGSESSDDEYATDFSGNNQTRQPTNVVNAMPETNHLKQVKLMSLSNGSHYTKLQTSDGSSSHIDTSFLVPKDAYFHDLSKTNRPSLNPHTTTEKAMPQVIGRNRNPLPYSIACATDILADHHLGSDLSTYYQNGVNLPNDSTSFEHQMLHGKFIPNEKLLSQRKFETNHRLLSPMHEITIMNGANSHDDLSPMDHEYKNDSGYTNNSHESSPSLLKSSDSDKNGKFSQTYIPDAETDLLATATGIPVTQNCNRKNSSNFVSANFSASSLV